MKDKLKYNLLHIILFTIINCINVFTMLRSWASLVVIPSVQTGASGSHFVRWSKFLKKALYFKKKFCRVAISYRNRFQRKNLVMTEKKVITSNQCTKSPFSSHISSKNYKNKLSILIEPMVANFVLN